ncbi:hypothetical protein C0Q70_08479 [Pomacea canaliculata]|uniref:FAD/NAD(P)-binding domain-containing protein n=1 Tax=Pomacea canaliculata TaxID=400727 RepID=A0A2T7PHY1_POMCA|nr:hypothetical protein C0Q70_08479 [Pomacea canaliculata]
MTGSSSSKFDLVVIGGGSGGLACSKEAADLGRRVAVLDFVKPSAHGTKWGLGGTCVNVGCIPKKLMHQAAGLGHALVDARSFGWEVPEAVGFSWKRLTAGVQDYIKSLNWGYRVQLKDKKVEYLNAYGTLVDKHTVKAVNAKGKEQILTADNIVIAVGGRPHIPEIPGALEHAITSDDIFWKSEPPGKTNSDIALETAGILTGLGFDTTVMVRSICLRNFDQQMSRLVTDHMKREGTRFLWKSNPLKIEKRSNGRLLVTYSDIEGSNHQEEFDTVIMATGRRASTKSLELESVGVELLSGKVIGGFENDNEKSSVPNIYAIGDVLHGGLELTPVAIKAGKLLAHRLFGEEKRQMDYSKVPTTVFTPLEYGCVGLSEQDALLKYGEDFLEVICHRHKPQQVLGIHLTGPNAGEIIQGFAVALRSVCSPVSG